MNGYEDRKLSGSKQLPMYWSTAPPAWLRDQVRARRPYESYEGREREIIDISARAEAWAGSAIAYLFGAARHYKYKLTPGTAIDAYWKSNGPMLMNHRVASIPSAQPLPEFAASFRSFEPEYVERDDPRIELLRAKVQQLAPGAILRGAIVSHLISSMRTGIDFPGQQLIEGASYDVDETELGRRVSIHGVTISNGGSSTYAQLIGVDLPIADAAAARMIDEMRRVTEGAQALAALLGARRVDAIRVAPWRSGGARPRLWKALGYPFRSTALDDDHWSVESAAH
jgi:hypothetical protein